MSLRKAELYGGEKNTSQTQGRSGWEERMAQSMRINSSSKPGWVETEGDTGLRASVCSWQVTP